MLFYISLQNLNVNQALSVFLQMQSELERNISKELNNGEFELNQALSDTRL